MHDVVARAQIGERLKRASTDPPLAGHTAAEDLCVGEQDEPEIAPDEAAARRRDGEEQRRFIRQGLAFLEDARLDAPEEILLAQRFAAVRERDDDAMACAHERGELVLRFGEPARDESRALRLEGERLALRQRIELGSATERNGIKALLLPDGPHLVALPDEVDGLRQRPNEIRRDRDRFVFAEEFRRGEIEASFGRWIDHRLVDRMERALRERRERADVLDLVAPELDAKRLASRGREHVDEATAHCELSALVGALDALVTRQRERL